MMTGNGVLPRDPGSALHDGKRKLCNMVRLHPTSERKKKSQPGTTVLTCLPQSLGDERNPATTGGEWLGSNTLLDRT